MKKYLLSMLLTLLIPLGAVAQEAYAVLDGSTLTFYYDNQRSTRSGTKYSLNTGSNVPGWYSKGSSITKVAFDSSFADARPTSTNHWFWGANGLTEIEGIQYLNTANVTTMTNMFAGCSSLTSLDVSGFNTGKVTDMVGMFSDCSGLTSLDLSGFNTENVTYMYTMFYGCSGLTSLDVSGFDTGNVTSMSNMFNGCSSLTSLDVSGFDTKKVTKMSYMFFNCSGLTSLDVSGFDTKKVTNMDGMFFNCSGLTSLDVSGFDTGNVTIMPGIFQGCSGLASLDVSGFDTGNVTNMSGMFAGCSSLTSLDLSGFDTGNVTYMGNMFDGCSGLTSLDLSGFDTGNVTSMSGMFNACSNLATIYCGNDWSTNAVTTDSDVFTDCTSLVGGKGTVYNSSQTGKAYAHADGGTSNPGYLTLKGTSEEQPEAYVVLDKSTLTLTFYYDNQKSLRNGTKYSLNTGLSKPGWYSDRGWISKVVFAPSFANARPTSTYSWFANASTLTEIEGIQYLNTGKVTVMEDMFYMCTNLTSLNVSGFNTRNATSMRDMFADCWSLTSLNVSGFDTGNVTDMGGMFSGCSGLTSLNVSGFDTGNVTNMYNMFNFCRNLTNLDVSGFDTRKVWRMEQMFQKCTGLTSLDLSGFDTRNVNWMGGMFSGCSNLTTIYCGNDWSVNAVNQDADIFTDCTSLVGGKGTVYNSSQTGKAYAHADGGPSNPGYLTLKDASTVEIPVDEEHFPDESFRQWIVNNVSGGDDSKLSEAEIAAIKTLDISGQNITDLTGIEYFTELTELRVHNNKLTRLDVSKNTKLIRLYAQDNELTEINVTKNIYLEELYVYNNKLTTIDVTKNTVLRILHVYNNVITNINLTYNVELTELYIYKNKLTVIDLTKNVKLVRLHIYNNELTEINLTYNVLLEELYIYNNKLTVIDLTKNVKLVRLHIYNNELTEINLTYNVLLEELYIHNNKLTVIDLTKNVKLVRLHIYNNELLWIRLTENTLIEEVEVSSQTMTRVVVNLGLHRYALVVPAGIDVTKITSLTVNGITITSENFYIDAEGRLVIVSTVKPTEIIYHYVTGYSTVKMRVVVNTTVSTTGIEVDEVNFPDAKLREWIIANLPGGEDGLLTDEEIALIKTIDISGLNITNLKGIELFTELEELYAYNNKITTVDLTKNVKLRIVHLYNNELTTINLNENVLIEELYIHNNKLTVIDLTKNVKLVRLHIYNNELTEINLTYNVLLEELYIYNNKLTVIDLTKNVKLVRLYIYNNELTEINLTYNVLLEELYIYNNKLTVIDLTKNVKLLIVHLYGNELTWLNLAENVLITEGSLSSQSISRTVYRKSSTQYGILVDGGFDLSKVSGLTVGGVETSAGGTSISDGYWIIPGVDGASSISYDYDTGNGNSTAKKMRVNVNLNNGGGMAMNTDDNSGMLEDNDGETGGVTLDGFTFSPEKWITLCLPFDATEEQAKAALGDNVDIEELNTSTWDEATQFLTLYFVPRTAIVAGMPYVVKVSATVNNPTFSGVTIKNVEPTTVYTTYCSTTGVYNATPLTVGDKSTLFIQNNRFYYPSAAGSLPATKCYFTLLGDAQQARGLGMHFWDDDDVASGIYSVTASTADQQSWYTPQGVRVSQPGKGLYIHGGKKVIVK